MKKVFSLLLALSMLITGSFGVMAQAQTIEPTNFDEINFQITSKENPDAYIESRFVPGNSAYARSSEEDGKTLVGYVDATVYVEETYTKGEDGNIFTTDSRLLSEEEVMSIGKSEFDVPVQSVQPRISTIGDKTTSRGKLTIRFTVMAYAVLRIGIAEYARQAAHRAVHRHGAVGAPHDIFALLAEASFLRAAGHLIPNHRAAPDPSGPLQSVGDGRILPPVDKQTDGRSRFAGFACIGQPFRHPSCPASLVPVIPVKIRQGVFRIHTAVFLIGRAVFLRGLPTARSIGRVGDKGIKHLRLECTDDLQGIPVQDAPSVPIAVLDRQHGFIYDLCQFVCIGQRHHPFCYRSISERVFGFVGVFSDNSVCTYSLIMLRAL